MTPSPHALMRDWPPEGVAFPVADIDIRVAAGELAELAAFRTEIDANWKAETDANPHLFNGRLVALYDVALDHAGVHAAGRMVPYAYHLWWRRQSLPPPTFHCFAMPVIVSADGAIIAIRMSQTTANAGKVYCASGSLEEDDIVDGRIDIDANMTREVAEETGIDLTGLKAGADYYCAHHRHCVMFYRFFYSERDAATLMQAVREHMKTDTEGEIDAVLAITAGNRGAFNYAFSMPPVLDLHFSNDS
ncbi:NUDIX hydrolase [Martelella endophytica]|uniref:DNA mismatch repair protein MutT n=1 Tax=Martelella endophytica TaxID=1486262 RepID=A0A0D5LSD1_MAREN|nr:hypothetical protein [Martelella endophytica]AJY46850.1 hypothetical protein TM49_16085 [Martelella endophytica]